MHIVQEGSHERPRLWMPAHRRAVVDIGSNSTVYPIPNRVHKAVAITTESDIGKSDASSARSLSCLTSPAEICDSVIRRRRCELIGNELRKGL